MCVGLASAATNRAFREAKIETSGIDNQPNVLQQHPQTPEVQHQHPTQTSDLQTATVNLPRPSSLKTNELSRPISATAPNTQFQCRKTQNNNNRTSTVPKTDLAVERNFLSCFATALFWFGICYYHVEQLAGSPGSPLQAYVGLMAARHEHERVGFRNSYNRVQTSRCQW